LACALNIERAARCAHHKCGASAPSPSLKNVTDRLNGFFTTKNDAGERQEFDQRLCARRNNSTLRLADPRNLVVAMLDGIGSENFPHRESMQKMPVFPTSSAIPRRLRSRTMCASPGAGRRTM
jgi:hypothetical protein